MLDRDRAALIVVDVQDRLFPKILALDSLLVRIPLLIRGIHILGIPTVVTEQYPQGLGHTIGPVQEALGESYQPLEKKSFSCLGNEQIRNHLETLRRDQNRDQLVICGIETHICVMQTWHHALEAGFEVYLCLDAISSRNAIDRETAIRRMEKGGAIPATVEMILFELMKTASAPEFKSISSLVKTL